MKAIVAVAVLLAACQTVPTAKTVCPAIKPYTPAEQSALADQLVTLPSDSPAVRFIIDYGQLRSEIRACQGAKP